MQKKGQKIMAKRNYKYNNTVDLSNLPVTTSRKYIDWKNSVGCIIPFTFMFILVFILLYSN